MSAGIFEFTTVQPLAWAGLTDPFWTVHNHIVFATWIAMALLFGIALLVRWVIQVDYKNGIYTAESLLTILINLCKDAFGDAYPRYVPFITCLFLFTFTCCIVGNIPNIEEATRDLNTTLALALCSFSFIQFHKIRVLGIKGFLHEFIEPIFILAPIHVIGEMAKVASMSFRLFGNVIGSSVILGMILEVATVYSAYFLGFASLVDIAWHFASITNAYEHSRALRLGLRIAFGLLFTLAWVQIVFGFLEGLLQAFVLTMLTTTYLSMAIAGHEVIETTDEQDEFLTGDTP